MRIIILPTMLFLTSLSVFAAPKSIDLAPLPAGNYRTNFAFEAESAMSETTTLIRESFGDDLANQFLQAMQFDELRDPRSLSKIEIDRIFCKGRFDTISNIPGLDLGFHNCIDSDSGEQIMFSGSGSSAFANYFYFLLQRQIDFRNWFRVQIAKIAEVHVKLGIVPTRAGVITFKNDIVESYFRSELRASGLAIETKIVELRNPIRFDDSGLTDSFVLKRDAIGRAGFPRIIEAVTCSGACVVIEKSSFAQFIGTYTYAFQILFHTDVWDNFSTEYAGLEGFGTNLDWYAWSDLVAGNGDPDTLRSSSYFRAALSQITIEGAAQ